jgi:hypothetical protein
MLTGEHLETIVERHIEIEKVSKLKEILKKFEE